jgi:hypothetical protein
MAEARRWRIYRWDERRFGVSGPDTTYAIPDGVIGLEAAEASEIQVMPVAEHEAFKARAAAAFDCIGGLPDLGETEADLADRVEFGDGIRIALALGHMLAADAEAS